MKEFEKVTMAVKNAHDVTSAFIKGQMLSYDELVFDTNVPSMKIGGKKKKLVSLKWNDEDELMLTYKDKNGSEEMNIMDLSIDEMYEFSKTMNLLVKEEI